MGHRTVSSQLFHHCGGMQAVRWLRRKAATILTYHKFPADRRMLESQCAYLKKHYRVISLGELSQFLRNGDPLPHSAVALTVDDGHRGFYQNAYPVFAKFGVPVTVNLTTGPIDTRGWLWFDRVAYSFVNSGLERVELPEPSREGTAASAPTTYPGADTVLGSREQRLGLAERYMEKMKVIPNQAIPECMDRLEQALRVQVPDEPPGEWALLNWDEVRLMARDGIDFGAHSVTHPILTQLPDEKSAYEEIAGARDRIQNELGKPVVHFAYPNGQPQDVSPAIAKIVADAGFETAVTTVSGQVYAGDNPFLLKRVSTGPELPLERFHMAVAAFRS